MKEYTVMIAGIEHTLQLSDEDVKERYPDAKPTGKSAPEPANKARQPKDK